MAAETLMLYGLGSEGCINSKAGGGEVLWEVFTSPSPHPCQVCGALKEHPKVHLAGTSTRGVCFPGSQITPQSIEVNLVVIIFHCR